MLVHLLFCVILFAWWCVLFWLKELVWTKYARLAWQPFWSCCYGNCGYYSCELLHIQKCLLHINLPYMCKLSRCVIWFSRNPRAKMGEFHNEPWEKFFSKTSFHLRTETRQQWENSTTLPYYGMMVSSYPKRYKQPARSCCFATGYNINCMDEKSEWTAWMHLYAWVEQAPLIYRMKDFNGET